MTPYDWLVILGFVVGLSQGVWIGWHIWSKKR